MQKNEKENISRIGWEVQDYSVILNYYVTLMINYGGLFLKCVPMRQCIKQRGSKF